MHPATKDPHVWERLNLYAKAVSWFKLSPPILNLPLILTKLIVQYCGKSCQQTHWSTHKGDCKSPLMKPTWRPSWVVEARRPAFINAVGNSFVDQLAHGRQKYLWGNVPATDILNLQQNEGVDFTKDLRLLFAGTRYATRLDPLLTPKQPLEM